MGFSSSKIYGSNQILFEVGSRKGKTQAHIALMVEESKHKKAQNKAYIAFLREKIAKEAASKKIKKATKKRKQRKTPYPVGFEYKKERK